MIHCYSARLASLPFEGLTTFSSFPSPGTILLLTKSPRVFSSIQLITFAVDSFAELYSIFSKASFSCFTLYTRYTTYWGGGPTPFFPKTHRNLDLGMGKNGEKVYEKRGNKVSIIRIEKIPIFAHDAPKFGFGDAKKCAKNGEKSIWKKREKLFVLTN